MTKSEKETLQPEIQQSQKYQALLLAAKDFYNLTLADTTVIIRPQTEKKQQAIIAAGQALRAAIESPLLTPQPVIQTAKLAILATFTHEILMGAISDSDLQHRAQLALETAGLKSLNDVVALTQSVVAPVRLTNLDITKIGVGGNTEWSIDFARAIEKAHGITTDNVLSQTVKTTPKPEADHI